MTRFRPIALVLVGALVPLIVAAALWWTGWLALGPGSETPATDASTVGAEATTPSASPTSVEGATAPDDAVGSSLGAGVPASAEAEVQPARSARLALPVGGVVRERLVAEGAFVVTGQPLLRLEDERERARVAEAEADLAVADAQLEAARAGATAAQRTVVVAESGRALADAQVDAATAALRLTATQADATVAQAEAALRQAEAGRAQADATLAQARAAAAQAAAQVASAEAQRARAQAAVASAQLAVSERTLRAPFDGTVLAIDVELGELLAEPVLTLADTSAWYVQTTNLTELQVAAVQAGDELDVTIDALPGRDFRASVERVGARPRPVRGEVTYDVRLRLSDADLDAAATALLRPGMTAVVRGLTD